MDLHPSKCEIVCVRKNHLRSCDSLASSIFGLAGRRRICLACTTTKFGMTWNSAEKVAERVGLGFELPAG